jgi:hypothetical protein
MLGALPYRAVINLDAIPIGAACCSPGGLLL